MTSDLGNLHDDDGSDESSDGGDEASLGLGCTADEEGRLVGGGGGRSNCGRARGRGGNTSDDRRSSDGDSGLFRAGLA